MAEGDGARSREGTVEWYLKALTNYVGFGGRARRREYWMFALFNLIIAFGLAFVDVVAGTGVLSLLYGLGVFLPSLAVSVRRLHDVSKSGWWLLICLIPLIGALVLLYFAVSDGSPGENSYGPNPKAA